MVKVWNWIWVWFLESWEQSNIYEEACISYNKLSRGEICAAGFIPPGNGAGLGSYFKGELFIMIKSFYNVDLKITPTELEISS